MVDTTELNIEPCHGRRILASLCHLSGLVPVYGVAFSGCVWLLRRTSDRPVAFHAFQALIAQAIFHLALIVPLTGWGVAMLLRFLGAPMAESLLWCNALFVGLVFVAAWVAFLFSALQAYVSGRFQYPIIGKRLAEWCVSPDETKVMTQ